MNYLGRWLCHQPPSSGQEQCNYLSGSGCLERAGPFFSFIIVEFQESVLCRPLSKCWIYLMIPLVTRARACPVVRRTRPLGPAAQRLLSEGVMGAVPIATTVLPVSGAVHVPSLLLPLLCRLGLP